MVLGATVLRPDLVTLLGVAPDRAEPGYGWIEPDELVAGTDGKVRHVRSFWEKPAAADAERIRQQGWLWNTFVMVGRVSTLLALVRLTAPDLYRSFTEIAPALGTVGEWRALDRLYCGLPSMDFSRHVLTARPDRLAVLPVRDVHFSDLGDPERAWPPDGGQGRRLRCCRRASQSRSCCRLDLPILRAGSHAGWCVLAGIVP
jgi:mannose-1-phosphate guanylyltransferase